MPNCCAHHPVSACDWSRPVKKASSSGLRSRIGASHDVVVDLGERYLSSMRSAVAHQEFDCIMLARYSGWPRDLPLERGNYQLTDSMVVAMPQTAQTWQMDIWVPGTE